MSFSKNLGKITSQGIAQRHLQWGIKWPGCVCSFCITVIVSKVIRILKMCFKIQSKFSPSINQLLFPILLWHCRPIENLP